MAKKKDYNNVTFFHLQGKCHPSDYISALFNNFIKRKPDNCEDNLYSSLCKRITNKLGIIFIPSIEVIIQNYALKHGSLPIWEQVEFQVAIFFQRTKEIFVDDEKTSYLKELLSKYELLVKQDSSVINKKAVREIGIGFNSDCEQVESILDLIELQYRYEEGYSLCKEEIDNNVIIQEDKEKEFKVSLLKNKRDEKKKRRGLKTVSLELQSSEIIQEESPESKRAREELEWEETEKDKQQELRIKKKNRNKVKKNNKKRVKQLIQLVIPKWRELSIKMSQFNKLRLLSDLNNSRFRSLIKIQNSIRHYLSIRKRNQLVTSRWNQLSGKVSQINMFQQLSHLKDRRFRSLLKIQVIIRSYFSKLILIKLKNKLYKSILIQTLFRKFTYSKKWNKIKESCLKIQMTVRMWKNYRIKYQQKKLELEKKTEIKENVITTDKLCQPIKQPYLQHTMCRYFQNGVYCPWGENCRYSHGEKDLKYLQKPNSESECWFGRMCRKPDCPYTHLNGRVAFPSSL